MDLITSRTMDVTGKALNGLHERQRAIGANIANVMTPGYKREEVAFEGQLANIIQKDEVKQYLKGQNSIEHTPTELERMTGVSDEKKRLSPQEIAFLKENERGPFKPQIMNDIFSDGVKDGNNVELEKEMMDLTKTGTQYVILSKMQQKSYSGLAEVIKGGQ